MQYIPGCIQMQPDSLQRRITFGAVYTRYVFMMVDLHLCGICIQARTAGQTMLLTQRISTCGPLIASGGPVRKRP